MPPHSSNGDLRQQKLRPPKFIGSDAAEDQASGSRKAGGHSLCLGGNPVAECLRPLALNKIVAVIEQQQASFFEMLAYPDRGVQCRGQPIPGIKRSRGPLLKVEDRLQPQLAEQDITRGKPMIERADWGAEVLGD